MATTAFVDVHAYTSGDIPLSIFQSMIPNIKSPVFIETLTINAGAGGASAVWPSGAKGLGPPTGLLIIPDPTNTREIRILDTVDVATGQGIKLHKTNPTFLSLELTLGVQGGFIFNVTPPAPPTTQVVGILTLIWL